MASPQALLASCGPAVRLAVLDQRIFPAAPALSGLRAPVSVWIDQVERVFAVAQGLPVPRAPASAQAVRIYLLVPVSPGPRVPVSVWIDQVERVFPFASALPALRAPTSAQAVRIARMLVRVCRLPRDRFLLLPLPVF